MEPVDVGSLPADEIVDLLFDGGALKSLLGSHGAACFALARPMVAPNFFRELIQNSATLDATTRRHVAFVVFHGTKSAIIEDGEPYGVGQRGARIRLNGLSVSDDPSHYNGRSSRQPATLAGRVKDFFSKPLADRMRSQPDSLDYGALTRHMSRAATRLMSLSGIRESALPCLLFTDGNDFGRHLTVALSDDDPIKSLYRDALKPLSDQFGLLANYWNRRNELKSKVQSLAWNKERVATLPAEIAGIEAELVGEAQQAETKTLTLRAKVEELRRTEASATRDYVTAHPAEAKVMLKLQAELDAIEAGQTAFRSPGHRVMETAKLRKKLGRATQQLNDLSSQTRRALWVEIGRVQDQIEREFSKVRELERSKKYKTCYLADAKERVDQITPALLAEEEQSVRHAEAILRADGYSDSVLRTDKPSAYDAIECMFRRGLLGYKARPTPTKEKSMRILFLAANPTSTSRLDLEEELRSLEGELRGVKYREQITLTARHAVRPDDLIRYVRSEQPNVVHFSGHGSGKGIVLRSDDGGHTEVTGPNLQRFFQDRGVDLVVLNACYTRPQAESIVKAVGAIVGTTDAVGDEAARRFTVAFYRALGDGYTIREAFRDGGDAVALHNLDDVFWSLGNVEIGLAAGNP